MENNKFKKICAWLLALSPIIESYEFIFLPKIPIIFILYLISFIFLFIEIKRKKIELKKRTKTPLFMVAILIIISILDLILFGIGSNFIADFGKIVVWGLSVHLFSKFMDKKYFSSVILKVAFFATCILLIQSICFYILGIRLPNVFNFGLITYRGIDMSLLERGYRPASIFSEPARYSVYTLIALAITLLDNEAGSNKKRNTYFFVAGLLLSASTTGLALLVAIIIFYVIKTYQISIYKGVLATILLIVAALCVTLCGNFIINKTGNFGQLINQSIIKINNTDSNSRVGGSLDMIENNSDNSLFGYGVGNEYYIFDEQKYMNSLARCYLQFGIVGITAIFIYMISILFSSSNNTSMFLALMSIILMFTSNTMFSVTSIIMFLIILIYNRKDNAEEGING